MWKILFWIHAQVLNGLRDDRPVELTALRKRMERGDGGALRVHFKKAPQGRARIAAAIAIRAQRRQTAGHPRGNLIRHHFHIVADGNEWAGFARQCCFQIRLARRRCGVEPVPPLAVERTGAELFIVGRAPDIGGHVIPVGQNFLRPQGFPEDGATAKYLRPVFPARCARPKFVQAFTLQVN